MAFKTIFTAPIHFFKDLYRHIRRGPPRPTWSFPLHFSINTLKRLMEANKKNIKSARLFTNVSAPAGFHVRIEKCCIPRRAVPGLGTDEGFIQGEWISDKPTMKVLKKKKKIQNFKLSLNDPNVQSQHSTCNVDLSAGIDPTEKVLLYIHGGAHIVCHPGTHRWLTSRLSKRGHCKVLAISYRKSPEHPFPAALQDTISTYFWLITEKGYKPHQIVLGGDSAGGNLAVALCYWLRMFHDQERDSSNTEGDAMPLFDQITSMNWTELVPAGLVLFSPWMDLTHSMPSYLLNGLWDYLPSDVGDPKHLPKRADCPCDSCQFFDKNRDLNGKAKISQSEFRKQYYAPDCLLTHPLVSPLWASVDDSIIQDFRRDKFGDHISTNKLSTGNESFNYNVANEIFGSGRVKVWCAVGGVERLRDEAVTWWAQTWGKDIIGDWWKERKNNQGAHELDGSAVSSNTSPHHSVAIDQMSIPESPVDSYVPARTAALKMEVYADMPHVPPLFFLSNVSKTCIKRAGQFIRDLDTVEGVSAFKIRKRGRHERSNDGSESVIVEEVGKEVLVEEVTEGLNEVGLCGMYAL